MSEDDFAPPASEAECHERMAEARAQLARVEQVLRRVPCGDPAAHRLWRDQALRERADYQVEIQRLKGWLRAHTAAIHEESRQRRAQDRADEQAARRANLARKAAQREARKALKGPDALVYNLYIALARRVGQAPGEAEKALLHTAQQYLAELGVLGNE